MLGDRHYIGAYWGARKESIGECTQRAELFFQLLSRCDVSFHQWYRSGRVARGMPGHLVRTQDRDELETALLRGRNRTDLSRSVIEELGFSLSVWNQRPDSQATRLSITCGVHDTDNVSNVCLLIPPSTGGAAERLLTASVSARVLECMALAWDPDWGTATSHEASGLISGAENRSADVGWVTYLSRRRGTVPPLPAPVRIEPVGSLGMLLILTPERFTASNPEHIALGRRVRELLDRAGLLRASPS